MVVTHPLDQATSRIGFGTLSLNLFVWDWSDHQRNHYTLLVRISCTSLPGDESFFLPKHLVPQLRFPFEMVCNQWDFFFIWGNFKLKKHALSANPTSWLFISIEKRKVKFCQLWNISATWASWSLDQYAIDTSWILIHPYESFRPGCDLDHSSFDCREHLLNWSNMCCKPEGKEPT